MVCVFKKNVYFCKKKLVLGIADFPISFYYKNLRN